MIIPRNGVKMNVFNFSMPKLVDPFDDSFL